MTFNILGGVSYNFYCGWLDQLFVSFVPKKEVKDRINFESFCAGTAAIENLSHAHRRECVSVS